MRRHLVAAMAACLTVAGCSDDDATYRGDGYSLTVFVYDALTGAPIDSAALASGVVLYEGATKVQAVALDSTRAGAVVFNDVPADYFAGNKVYPIVANVAGYQAYQGEVHFTTNRGGSTSTGPDVLEDDLYAQVGYIRLWPVGFHAPDYTFTVLFNGKPVPNAAVQFRPDDDDSYGEGSGNNQNDDVIEATYGGMIPAVSGTTDASGNVTFAGASLMLGAYYYVDVAPVVFEGVQLAAYSDGWYQVGNSDATQVLSLTNLDSIPGGNAYGLYVKSISNSVDGQVDATGTLTIVFSRPVVLHTSATLLFGASETSPVGVLATPPVSATLSSDGLTLTLTPSSWSTPPGAGETNTSITYNDGTAFLTVVGYPADAFTVFGLSSVDGVISGTVQLTGP